MTLSITRIELLDYISAQLNNLYPDKYPVNSKYLNPYFNTAMDRLDYCFKHVKFDRYNNNGQVLFNHLYTDQYLVFLWFLANTVWRDSGNENVYTKLYYLNKSLHGFDCMYNTLLPDIFLILHGAGTMLGKAKYSNFFVALHGCTVGSQKGEYPILEQGVTLTANSSIIGSSKIGKRCTISAGTTLYQTNLPDDSVAFIDSKKGILQIKTSLQCYAQQYFNVDLKTL